MATLDGYSPYPIELTAEQSVYAIKRAWNLDSELINYIYRTIGSTAPAKPSFGDYWTNEDKVFRAYVEGANVIWIEE